MTATITISVKEHEALTKVYAVAVKLRQFPVPFDDHFELVGAVDQCRSVLEPPVDDSPLVPPSRWQRYLDTYPREEFRAEFQRAHDALHKLWTAAIDQKNYDKTLWKALDNALARFARDAAGTVGIKQEEPLL